MTNDELLEQMRKLMRKENEALEKRLNAKIDGTKQEILAGIVKGAKDIAGFFHEMWQKMEATNERVNILEDDVGIADPTKTNPHYQEELSLLKKSYEKLNSREKALPASHTINSL